MWKNTVNGYQLHGFLSFKGFKANGSVHISVLASFKLKQNEFLWMLSTKTVSNREASEKHKVLHKSYCRNRHRCRQIRVCRHLPSGLIILRVCTWNGAIHHENLDSNIYLRFLSVCSVSLSREACATQINEKASSKYILLCKCNPEKDFSRNSLMEFNLRVAWRLCLLWHRPFFLLLTVPFSFEPREASLI